VFNPVILSFVGSLIAFILIGAYASRRKTDTTEDYLLASRSIGPWFTALSAVSTNNSGFMFIGLIGTTYTMGLSAVWIMFGWIFGDYLMWFWIHRRLREGSEARHARTIPSFLAAEMPGGRRLVQGTAAVIILAFLGTYSAAQLNAGSKALNVLFGWPYAVGAIVGAVIVVIYCFAGGIRASIWTDVVQSINMIFAVWLLFGLALYEVGGFSSLWSQLEAIDPQLINWSPPNPRFGLALFVFGWFGAGIGVVGQPHIMVRAMSIRSGQDIAKARDIYLVWYLLFTIACYGVALACRILIPDVGAFDAELALPTLALEYLPGVLVGLVLAGLFAATMSTADSQVLSCSAALTQDLFPEWSESYAKSKSATLLVMAAVLGIALFASQNVFALVTLSWSALAASLGPLLIVRAMGWPVNARTGFGMMVGGLAGAIVWGKVLGYGNDLFEAMPGFLLGFTVYLLMRPGGPPTRQQLSGVTGKSGVKHRRRRGFAARQGSQPNAAS
jgi:sodium/proline symporter